MRAERQATAASGSTTAYAVVAALVLLLAVSAPSPARADPLPFLADGVGLRPGQVVEAFNKGVSVGTTTVDASGNWSISIPASAAADGDRIAFTLDGKVTREGVTFRSGQFIPGRGLPLTVPGAFNSAPTYSAAGVSQVVFSGSVSQLEDAATTAGARSAWVQDSSGVFVALIPGAPAFVNAVFNQNFAVGFSAPTTVTLVK